MDFKLVIYYYIYLSLHHIHAFLSQSLQASVYVDLSLCCRLVEEVVKRYKRTSSANASANNKQDE